MACKICTKDYNKSVRIPKCLPCGHTFCSLCLTAILERNVTRTIRCPSCRKNVTLSDRDDLPTVFDLLGAAAASDDPITQDDNSAKCSQHKDKTAELVCMDCKIIMCAACVIKSFKSKDHTNHTIADIGEALESVQKQKQKVIAATQTAIDQAQEELDRKKRALDVALKHNIANIKREVNDVILQAKQWEQSMIDNVDSQASKIYNKITTTYQDVIKHLETEESIQQMGIFDTDNIGSSYPPQNFSQAMDKLKSLGCHLEVTAKLKLIEIAGIRRKESISCCSQVR